MAGQFDIKLDDFSSGQTELQLQSPQALLTESIRDAYRVMKGGVLVYLVPVNKGIIERRKKIAELAEGEFFTS